MPATRNPTDRLLIVEAILAVILIGLGIYLYLRPAAEGLATAEWWHWVLLAGLFFAIVGLHTWRRQRASHRALHDAIRRDAEERARTE